jgi:hypothetical protein
MRCLFDESIFILIHKLIKRYLYPEMVESKPTLKVLVAD